MTTGEALFVFWLVSIAAFLGGWMLRGCFSQGVMMKELEKLIKEVGTKIEIMYDVHTEAFYGFVRDSCGKVVLDSEECDSIKEVISNLREIAEYPNGRGDQD